MSSERVIYVVFAVTVLVTLFVLPRIGRKKCKESYWETVMCKTAVVGLEDLASSSCNPESPWVAIDKNSNDLPWGEKCILINKSAGVETLAVLKRSESFYTHFIDLRPIWNLTTKP